MFDTKEAAWADSKLEDETGRLMALRRYAVLDTPPERNLELITGLVRDLLRVPICAISLVDQYEQWFTSITGADLSGTPRADAFCDHTIRSYRCLAVENATTDPRFADNPLVTGSPFIRSYAGAPLTTPDGYNLGALCVLDRKPRHFFEDEQRLLARFAALVVEQLGLRTLATQDALTGAMSRRAFVDAATGALRQFERDRRPMALISFDIDHFKAVNDRWRHPAGDPCADVRGRHVSPAHAATRQSRASGRRGIRSSSERRRCHNGIPLRRAVTEGGERF